MKKPFFIIVLTIITGVLVLTILTFFKHSVSSEFRINEVSFNNNNGNDWIEIYNPGLNTRSLKGMYLTDSKEDFTRYEIRKDIIISPNGFAVIYGKNYSGEDENEVLKVNFNIKNGETVYLIGRNKKVVDSLTVLTEKNGSTAETTIGRFPNGYEDTFLMSTPTKGKTNIKDMMKNLNSEQ